MRVKALSEVKHCSPTIIWFYDKFRPQIAKIQTVGRRNAILSDMEEQFRKRVLHEPNCRDDLSEVYQLLKQKCWEVLA
ncbi:hypothetical protein AALC25_20885 [Lachnospiraceae bacterium 29-84]